MYDITAMNMSIIPEFTSYVISQGICLSIKLSDALVTIVSHCQAVPAPDKRSIQPDNWEVANVPDVLKEQSHSPS